MYFAMFLYLLSHNDYVQLDIYIYQIFILWCTQHMRCANDLWVSTVGDALVMHHLHSQESKAVHHQQIFWLAHNFQKKKVKPTSNPNISQPENLPSHPVQCCRLQRLHWSGGRCFIDCNVWPCGEYGFPEEWAENVFFGVEKWLVMVRDWRFKNSSKVTNSWFGAVWLPGVFKIANHMGECFGASISSWEIMMTWDWPKGDELKLANGLEKKFVAKKAVEMSHICWLAIEIE